MLVLGRYRKLTRQDTNDTHQVSAYANGVNLIDDDNRIIERNPDVLLNACKE